ncbi:MULTISPECIES: hypothetical protein [unclassified Beijerinckia]|uniref:hypothetical protein n=1 Tax=unclassified Beijerinckia TaxID=2638183 RepID=UPI00089D031C|nr:MULTISPECIES: hypothetical protein [unclassified Beijerinckia]MDH7796665.1 hypothetical protein [Beijerinckia sp. GAS462]SEC54779.1 hypothetical protein SAMN05443249_2949 [Beijerinckia sp. 28-YEA-48]
MTHDVDTDHTDERSSRLAVRLVLAGFGLMFVAAMAMWINFGPTIFMDLVTAVASCF